MQRVDPSPIDGQASFRLQSGPWAAGESGQCLNEGERMISKRALLDPTSRTDLAEVTQRPTLTPPSKLRSEGPEGSRGLGHEQ